MLALQSGDLWLASELLAGASFVTVVVVSGVCGIVGEAVDPSVKLSVREPSWDGVVISM